jgi:chromosome segregation ATPase
MAWWIPQLPEEEWVQWPYTIPVSIGVVSFWWTIFQSLRNAIFSPDGNGSTMEDTLKAWLWNYLDTWLYLLLLLHDLVYSIGWLVLRIPSSLRKLYVTIFNTLTSAAHVGIDTFRPTKRAVCSGISSVRTSIHDVLAQRKAYRAAVEEADRLKEENSKMKMIAAQVKGKVSKLVSKVKTESLLFNRFRKGLPSSFDSYNFNRKVILGKNQQLWNQAKEIKALEEELEATKRILDLDGSRVARLTEQLTHADNANKALSVRVEELEARQATANCSGSDESEGLRTQVEILTTALASEEAAARNEKTGLLWSVGAERDRADALQRKLEAAEATFKKALADQEAQAEEELGDIAKLNADFADESVAKDARIKELEERLAAAVVSPVATTDSGVQTSVTLQELQGAGAAGVEAAVRGNAAAEEALKANVMTLEEEAASLKAANSQLKAEVGQAESARASAEESSAALKQQLAVVTAELEDTKKAAAEKANVGLESVEQELSAARGELEVVREQVEKSNAATGQWQAYWKEADRCREDNAQKLLACGQEIDRLRKGRDLAYQRAQEEIRKREQAEGDRDSEKAKKEERQQQLQESKRQAEQEKRDFQKKLEKAEEVCRSKDEELRGHVAAIAELTMAAAEDMEVDPATSITAPVPALVPISDDMEVEAQGTPARTAPQTPTPHRSSGFGSSISSFQSQSTTGRSVGTPLSELGRAADLRQRQIDDLNRRLNGQADHIKELFAEREELEEDNAELERENWDLIEKIKKLEKEINELKQKIDKFDEAENEAQIDNAFLKDEIDELKQSMSKLEELKQLNMSLSNQAEASSMSARMYKEKAEAAEAKVKQLRPPQPDEAPGSPRKVAGVKRTAQQDQCAKKANTSTSANPFANLLQPQQQQPQQGQIQQQPQQQGQIQPQPIQPAPEAQREKIQEPEMSEEAIWNLRNEAER